VQILHGLCAVRCALLALGLGHGVRGEGSEQGRVGNARVRDQSNVSETLGVPVKVSGALEGLILVSRVEPYRDSGRTTQDVQGV
jgi:hypothetical protein